MSYNRNYGYAPVYDGKLSLYYSNTPLWSQPYTFCNSDYDCRHQPGAPRCLGIGFDQVCSGNCANGSNSCICTNAVAAARFASARRTPHFIIR
jgi:hypothetical protein